MSSGMDLHTELRCPNCGKTAQVKNLVLSSARMHRCPKLRGLIAPMVRSSVTAEIVLHEREDYVGKSNVQLDPERKRPVMSMETKYDDGHTDLTVFAPAATAKIRR